ncbi:MAG: hypothetical protein AB7N80_11375 [Bdellovibrionales bacterium]
MTQKFAKKCSKCALRLVTEQFAKMLSVVFRNVGEIDFKKNDQLVGVALADFE